MRRSRVRFLSPAPTEHLTPSQGVSEPASLLGVAGFLLSHAVSRHGITCQHVVGTDVGIRGTHARCCQTAGRPCQAHKGAGVVEEAGGARSALRWSTNAITLAERLRRAGYTAWMSALGSSQSVSTCTSRPERREGATCHSERCRMPRTCRAQSSAVSPSLVEPGPRTFTVCLSAPQRSCHCP